MTERANGHDHDTAAHNRRPTERWSGQAGRRTRLDLDGDDLYALADELQGTIGNRATAALLRQYGIGSPAPYLAVDDHGQVTAAEDTALVGSPPLIATQPTAHAAPQGRLTVTHPSPGNTPLRRDGAPIARAEGGAVGHAGLEREGPTNEPGGVARAASAPDTPIGAEGGPAGPELTTRVGAKRGSGTPLDETTRGRMEGALGASFADVGVHIDPEADALNRQVSAVAFTTGTDIFFREGTYQPGTPTGQRLLAHELTHVVQQRGASYDGPLVVGPADDAHEHEAEATSTAVAAVAALPGASPALRAAQHPSHNAPAAVMSRVIQRFTGSVAHHPAVSPNPHHDTESPHGEPSDGAEGAHLVIAQVLAASRAAHGHLLAQVAQGTATISTAVWQEQAAIAAAEAGESAALQGIFAAAHGQVAQTIAQGRAKLQGEAATHRATLERWHATATSQAQAGFRAHQGQAHALGENYAGQAITVANEAAGQGQREIEDLARQAQAIGDAKAHASDKPPGVAQAKAGAAHKIADDTAAKITDSVASVVVNLRGSGPKTASSYRQKGQEAAAKVGEGLPKLLAQINNSAQTATHAIDQALRHSEQALTHAQNTLTNRLAALDRDARSKLRGQVTKQSRALGSAGQRAAMDLQHAGQQAAAMGDAHVRAATAQIAHMPIDPAKAAVAAVMVVGRVDKAYAGASTRAGAAATAVHGVVTEVGVKAAGVIKRMAPHVSSQVRHAVEQARSQVEHVTGEFSSKVAGAVAHTTSGDVVGRALAHLEQPIARLKESFAHGLGSYRKGLSEQVKDKVGQGRKQLDGLNGRIDQAQARIQAKAEAEQAKAKAEAERKKHEGLFDKIGDALAQAKDWVVGHLAQLWKFISDPAFYLPIAVGFLLAAGTALIIAALPAELSLLAVFAIAAGIGAVIGGVVNVVGQIVQNVQAGKSWNADLANAFITGAIGGAVIGVVSEVLALVGAGIVLVLVALDAVTAATVVITNLVTHKPLTDGLGENLVITTLTAGLDHFVHLKADPRAADARATTRARKDYAAAKDRGYRGAKTEDDFVNLYHGGADGGKRIPPKRYNPDTHRWRNATDADTRTKAEEQIAPAKERYDQATAAARAYKDFTTARRRDYRSDVTGGDDLDKLRHDFVERYKKGEVYDPDTHRWSRVESDAAAHPSHSQSPQAHATALKEKEGVVVNEATRAGMSSSNADTFTRAAPVEAEAKGTAARLGITLDDLELVPGSSNGHVFMAKGADTPSAREVQFAETIASEKGDDFVFPKAKNEAGIDGFWRSDGHPVQLKTLDSSPKNQPSKVVARVNDAYDAASNGWNDVELYMEARGVPKEEVAARWDQPNRIPALRKMNSGIITMIRVYCSDGVVDLPIPSGS